MEILHKTWLVLTRQPQVQSRKAGTAHAEPQKRISHLTHHHSTLIASHIHLLIITFQEFNIPPAAHSSLMSDPQPTKKCAQCGQVKKPSAFPPELKSFSLPEIYVCHKCLVGNDEIAESAVAADDPVHRAEVSPFRHRKTMVRKTRGPPPLTARRHGKSGPNRAAAATQRETKTAATMRHRSV